jgi:hypothetical protein
MLEGDNPSFWDEFIKKITVNSYSYF